MKPIRWLSAVVLCLAAVSYAAAEESGLNVVSVRPALDTAQLQYVLTHERKEVFERGMALTLQQSKVFWDLYHQFDKEKKQLDAKRIRLLGTYINKFSTLTNDDAIKLVKQSGRNQQADLSLRQKYFKLLSKKLNPVVAARFVQLDDMIGMAVRLAILGNVPLIGSPTEETGQPTGNEQPTSSEAAPK